MVSLLRMVVVGIEYDYTVIRKIYTSNNYFPRVSITKDNDMSICHAHTLA